ncbi:hypothetical protein P8452_21284 [Trifolium repens]|nr:hypothetical protein P8452_21284 [Trifolium repens]
MLNSLPHQEDIASAPLLVTQPPALHSAVDLISGERSPASNLLNCIVFAISTMTLLEVIKDASVNSKSLDLHSDYPVVLNPDPILPNLKSELKDESSSYPIKPVIGWKMSQTDKEIIEINKKFIVELKTKFKSINNLEKDEFIGSLISYLENIREKVGFSIEIGNSSGSVYCKILIDKLGSFVGKDVASLVLDGCVSLEIWELVEALIVNGVIGNSCYSNLVAKLIKKKRRSGRENQATSAIEKASDDNLKLMNSLVAKEASILFMIAYDGFSAAELCLHYLIASPNLNNAMLSPAFNKLNGKELLNLILYLAKWLKKYERFPQAGPCPKASSSLGLKACNWIPKLEDVVKCLGLVLDENFSSLVLHSQFHEELRLIEGLVSCLTTEAKICNMVNVVIDKLKIEATRGRVMMI